MKYLSFFIFFAFISCEKQETILLPKSDITVVKMIADLSPIYIFFKWNGKDTLAEVNRKNTIISTNWVFNIDKRLPLRIVIPEIVKLQDKKRNDSAHKNESAQNYYSYADSIHKNLAFLPFTEVYYKMEKPLYSFVVFFSKKNEIFVDGTLRNREELKHFLTSLPKDKLKIIRFQFDANMNYGNYVQNEIFLQSLKMNNNEEFIF